MRLASFNLENLFTRPVALSGLDQTANADILDAFARVEQTLLHDSYTDADKVAICAGLTTLGLSKSDESDWVILRQNKGRLIERRNGVMSVVAAGRSSWIGWVDLKRETIDEEGTRNTARVIHDVGADVIATIEVEGRSALVRFNDELLGDRESTIAVGTADPGSPDATPKYAHVMAITGNDARGITVGVMSRDGYSIADIVSHVDDTDQTGLVFSRDCAEYRLTTPSGASILLLVNHLKSKGFGSQAANDAKRRRQAQRVADLYRQRRVEGVELIAVLGDFNETPLGSSLAPLLEQTDLRDISEHDAFDTGGLPDHPDPTLLGTFGTGTRPAKIDYILLSPALYEHATSGGVFRKGVWSSTKHKAWSCYPTVDSPQRAASDHAAIWADISI